LIIFAPEEAEIFKDYLFILAAKPYTPFPFWKKNHFPLS
jgi:hypothetical protein